MTIGRVHGTIRLPASFLLVAAANPCPCGWYEVTDDDGKKLRECTCSRSMIDHYRARLSGPLLDRIDLQVPVRPVSLKELRDEKPAESSSVVRERVAAARDRQLRRFADAAIRTNAEMTSKLVRQHCRLDQAGEDELARIVVTNKSMSARGITRLLKVALTVADLCGEERITPKILREASAYRAVDPTTDIALELAPADTPKVSSRFGRKNVASDLGTTAASNIGTTPQTNLDSITSLQPTTTLQPESLPS